MTSKLDRELGDIIKENNRNQRSGSYGRKQHSRVSSDRSAPYQVQRKPSANAVPSGQREKAGGTWKHDLFNTVNKNVAPNGAKGAQRKEEIIQFPNKEEVIQFPPRQYTEDEKAKLLQGNPLFQRIDSDRVVFPPPKAPPKTPTRPAALTKSVSTPNLNPQPTSMPSSNRSISIVGAASASVIMSNITPSASVEDIRAILSGLGGGVKEIHIISQSGQSDRGLKVKVTFMNPAEGGRECIDRFNGVVADGRKISVEFEKVSTPTQPLSFASSAGQNMAGVPRGPRAQRRNRHRPQGGTSNTSQPTTGNEAVARLYSDDMI